MVIYWMLIRIITFHLAWGWVKHGHSGNLGRVNSAAKKPFKVIRSRSHAGGVDEVIQREIGADTKIIEAGGAGECFVSSI